MRNLNDPETGAPKAFDIAKNVFMIIVYLAVGGLFIGRFFNIDNDTVSYCVGGLLIAYAILRIYRLYRDTRKSDDPTTPQKS